MAADPMQGTSGAYERKAVELAQAQKIELAQVYATLALAAATQEASRRISR